jgi:hypothetical protein
MGKKKARLSLRKSGFTIGASHIPARSRDENLKAT